MTQQRLLIVDDEADMLEGLKRTFSYELEGINILTASTAKQTLRSIRQVSIDVVLLDIRMPDVDGLELLAAIRKEDPWLTIIMMTAYGSIELAVEAIRRGAYDFVTKPFEKETLLRVLANALERNRLIRENLNLRRRICDELGFHGFVGQSAHMRRMLESIQAIARTDYTVFIRGESGTGKELAARAIHALSKRQDRQMVTVNCPAIPEHLLESELFGHKRGAFTSAEHDQTGLFKEAHRGTIFLDEIGDIPVSIQTKLLRVLQEKEIKPLGENKTQKVDIRIIASTNQNIEEKIREHSFREDLFHRLNVVTLKTPSLEQLRDDIPLLVNHFSRRVSSELGITSKRFTPGALEKLMHRSWPGNVRELENIVCRIVMFSADRVIRSNELRALEDLRFPSIGLESLAKPEKNDVEPYKLVKNRVINQFTFNYVSDLLGKTDGNVTRAAELSGLGRASLQKIMRRLGMKSETYKNG